MNLDLTTLEYKQEVKKKDAFYASDVQRPAFELWHQLAGTPITNQMNWYDTLKMGAGNGVESSMLKVLKDSGIVAEDYDQHVQGKVNFERDGLTIHGRIDALTKDGLPIEIKSINNKNQWDIKAYETGYPRENYVGQLAVYMDALGVDIGHLFVATVDGLGRFWFECRREGDVFSCGNVKFNLAKEYDRWREILKLDKPDVFEYRYKIPVDEIDWSKVSADKISKARNNKAVIGDYQVTYSRFKDLWIKSQGVEQGYTAEEILKIRKLTNNYTSKDASKRFK